jgi:hypothetical protein
MILDAPMPVRHGIQRPAYHFSRLTRGRPRESLRDGDPGEPEEALGGFVSTWRQRAVEIHVNRGDAAARDVAVGDLCSGLVWRSRLSGLAFGAQPTADRSRRSRRSRGAPAIKTTLIAAVDYGMTFLFREPKPSREGVNQLTPG